MKVLGLDIGITSCGWGLVDLESSKIIDLGVRIFTAAENPKTGSSLNQPRKEARCSRKRLRRRKQRLKKLQSKLIEFGILEDNVKIHSNPDIWKLRVKALETKLTGYEITSLLHQIGKRRGFKSN